MAAAQEINTLEYFAEHCINCGMCSVVCPHGVFEPGNKMARLARPHLCMECGACRQNCPTEAIAVDSGVGCAAAMIRAVLRGKQVATCGSDDEPTCGCG